MSLVRFNSNGEVVFIYEDGHPLLGLGGLNIKRASHVEPDEQGEWVANLQPVQGPRLESEKVRHHALSKEISWIESHLIDPPARANSLPQQGMLWWE